MEINKFLESKGMGNKTIKTYTSIINNVVLKIGNNFTEEQLEEYLGSLNLKPRTYNLYRTIMNFYTTKYLGYVINFNKAKLDNALPTYVSQEEFNRVIFTIPNIKHKLILKIMYLSGLRIFEVVRLKKHHIIFNNLIIFVEEGKGKKDRYTILPLSLANELKEYIKSNNFSDTDYIFPAFREHITEKSIQERLKKAIFDSKVKYFSCHDLRHSFSINIINKGIDLSILQKLLGHSSIKTTQVYLQCRNIDLTKIALSISD